MLSRHKRTPCRRSNNLWPICRLATQRPFRLPQSSVCCLIRGPCSRSRTRGLQTGFRKPFNRAPHSTIPFVLCSRVRSPRHLYGNCNCWLPRLQHVGEKLPPWRRTLMHQSTNQSLSTVARRRRDGHARLLACTVNLVCASDSACKLVRTALFQKASHRVDDHLHVANGCRRVAAGTQMAVSYRHSLPTITLSYTVRLKIFVREYQHC